MGRQANPLHLKQRIGGRGNRLRRKDIQARACNHPLLQRLNQLLFTHHIPAGGINQYGAGFHFAELRHADRAPGLRRGRQMQADKVRFPEYEIQIRHTLNIARQNTGVGVITQHPHAEALRGNLRHMAADVAAADDTNRLAV